MWEPGLSSGLCYYVHPIESESVISKIVVCVCRIILNLANCANSCPLLLSKLSLLWMIVYLVILPMGMGSTASALLTFNHRNI